jgi:hypothetical protein
MDGRSARLVYGIAVPTNRQYRSLRERLPALAKGRLHPFVFWVSRISEGFEMSVE